MPLCILVFIFLQGVKGQRSEVVGAEPAKEQEQTEENGGVTVVYIQTEE